MYSKQTAIVNETGIHARPASEFVQEAKKYKCKIMVRNVNTGGDAVNGKSIARIIGEEFINGSVIEITADGEEEQEAVEALISLIVSGFSE